MRKSMRAVASVACVGVGLMGWAVGASASTGSLVLGGRGLTVAPLGTATTTAVRSITHAIGAPSTGLTATPFISACGVDHTATWRGVTVFFHHDLVVGVSVGPTGTPKVHTGAGLVLGDTLAHVRSLYPGHVTTSGDQGGVYVISTPQGRLKGFLTPSTGHPASSDRVATIDVGVVGCPAMSP